MVAKGKNLVALVPVLGAISRPVIPSMNLQIRELPKFQKDDEKEIMNPTQNLCYYIIIVTVFCQW